MKKLFVFFVLVLFMAFANSARAAGPYLLADQSAGSSAALASGRVEPAANDDHFLALFSYLNRQKSPLADYTWIFIRRADFWGVDWRLLPAISGVESSFGRAMVPGSFNAYGWGGGYIKFNGWRQSIDWINWKLRSGYYDKGLVSPGEINPVWAPPSPHWGRSVASIMAQISSF